MATFSEIRDRVKVVGERAEGVTVVTKPGESAPNVAAGRAALVIQEPTALFAEGDSSRGLDQWDVPLLLLAPFGDSSLVPDASSPLKNTPVKWDARPNGYAQPRRASAGP